MALYNSLDSFNSLILPPQMISLAEKLKDNGKWGKVCMDALEQIAYSQIQANYKFIENYEMVKGHFIPTHYFGEEGYKSLLEKLSEEFEIPNYLRHYDIISPVINTLSGEYQKRPDIFRVKAWDENSKNEFLTKKTELLSNYISSLIEKQVAEKMAEQGLDPYQQEFQSEEEQTAYNEFKQKIQSALTPPEIEDYMTTSFRTSAEIWGQAQLELDKQRFRLDEKEKKEFEDMLITDRCFRHFYLSPNGYEQETWNPVNVFLHKSPDVDETENGDYIGRQFYATPSDIVDRYGYRMTEEQLQLLEVNKQKEDKRWNEAPGYDYVYRNYMFPFKGYQGWDIGRRAAAGMGDGTDNSLIPHAPANLFNNLGGSFYSERLGMFLVTEAYWMSQEKIGLYTFIDPETELIVSKLVDENIVLPEDVVEIKEPTDTEKDVNTICWTWVNRVWKGVKININTLTVTDPKHDENAIYLDVQPLEFQFKGDINPYNAKLPVCGQVFSVRNSRSMSLVDLMKPYQIGFNVAMNQLYQLMEKEIGQFIVMDVNMFPDSKDWGGEDAWEKWMLVAKTIGLLPADTSPANTKGATAAAGGQFPKILDLNLASQMTSRVNLAQTFKQFALEQVGFNQYRLGNFNQSSTATGIEEGQARSFAQTESYFTQFYNYLRRCHRMALDIAQYTQSQQKDVTISFVKSDLSTAFIKVAGTDLSLADLHVYVTNSQEHLRQLETSRQLALSNNTTGATALDLFDIITMNTPSEIRKKLESSLKKQEQMQQQQLQVQQETSAKMLEVEQLKQAKEDERLDKKIESEEKMKAWELEAQYNVSLLESNQEAPAQDDSSKIDAQNQRNQIANQQRIDNKQLKEKDLALKNKKIDADLSIQNKELQSVKILKGKEDKK
jgi:hypothetical protein